MTQLSKISRKITPDLTSELQLGLKRQQLEEAIRSDIIARRLKPGQRLDSYGVMASRFGISKATYHFVVQKLKSDGYLHGIERQGTYVAEALPCFQHIGVVFGCDQYANFFFTRLTQEISSFKSDAGYKFLTFNGLEPGNVSTPPQLAVIRRHLENQTLAGLCFAYDPKQFEMLALLQEFPYFPYVVFDHYSNHPRALVVRLCHESAAEKALIYMQQHKRSLVAVISKADQPLAKTFVQLARQQDMYIPDAWILAIPNDYQEICENNIQLLMSLPADKRPDALFVTDDNLLTRVQSGLIKAGVSTPDDLLVVSHANFPDHNPSVLSVQKVGYDMGDLLNGCITAINRWNLQRQSDTIQIMAKLADE